MASAMKKNLYDSKSSPGPSPAQVPESVHIPAEIVHAMEELERQDRETGDWMGKEKARREVEVLKLAKEEEKEKLRFMHE
ncbi:uncharacterized protein VTP21DRAFT_5153 [Calcarisporiella thermophila]|uniref:uncharacterized protein n=1 Tax=Calcarisporiella thermophila TaxID=911321 RepID=UPI00374266B2